MTMMLFLNDNSRYKGAYTKKVFSFKKGYLCSGWTISVSCSILQQKVNKIEKYQMELYS